MAAGDTFGGTGPQLQLDALGEAGCVKFFQDKISSRKADRPGLAAALAYLRRRSGRAGPGG